MEALEAVFTRHSVDKVKPDPVPRDLIEKLLAAGMQAPNHFKVYPWRFVVIQGEGRSGFGDALAASLLRRVPDVSSEALAKERERAFRSPVLIAVGVAKPEDSREIELEDICACAAAVQNMLITAHALGLGAKWRTTGSGAYEPEVKQFLGFEEDQHVVAILYIGFPQQATQPPLRPSFEDRTHWI